MSTPELPGLDKIREMEERGELIPLAAKPVCNVVAELYYLQDDANRTEI